MNVKAANRCSEQVGYVVVPPSAWKAQVLDLIQNHPMLPTTIPSRHGKSILLRTDAACGPETGRPMMSFPHNGTLDGFLPLHVQAALQMVQELKPTMMGVIDGFRRANTKIWTRLWDRLLPPQLALQGRPDHAALPLHQARSAEAHCPAHTGSICS